jgi:hypothetical protein
MVDTALLILTGGAVSLGCVHSWRYLRRVRQAGADDRAARERVRAHYRHGIRRVETPTRRDDAAAIADRPGNRE